MSHWTFFDYMSPAGVNLIAKWYRGLTTQEQADFDALLLALGNSKFWSEPQFKRLTSKKYRGLGEMRFKCSQKQHRMIGMDGPGGNQYTLLIGCTKKQNVYNPTNALDTAVDRKGYLNRQQGSIADHE